MAVVSTDLSHYLDQDGRGERDARTAAAIVARDAAADPAGRTPAVTGRCAACCSTPPQRGLDVELLRLGTSADAAGEPDRVVGYGSFLVHAGRSD